MAKKTPALGTQFHSPYLKARAGVTPVPAAVASKSKAPRPVNVQKIAFWLRPEVVDRARDAAHYLSGPPEHLTLSGLVSDAIVEKIKLLAKKYHKGKPFPPHGKLKRGARPMLR